MESRVVITGLGAIAPTGNSIGEFTEGLRKGKSGIRYCPDLIKHEFLCLLGGQPQLDETEIESFTNRFSLVKLRSMGILYGCMAGVEAWGDSGLPILPHDADEPDWQSGCFFGSNSNGLEAIEQAIRLTKKGEVKRIGGRAAQQAMNSGISAYLGGIIGLGNQVTTNSSSGNTGLESIIESYYRIKCGLAERMLAGSSEGSNYHIWAGEDAMTTVDSIHSVIKGKESILQREDFYQNPDKACQPLSQYANGFVPGAGAGAVVLESLSSALARNATIYAEIVGVSVSSGAGTEGLLFDMNERGMRNCIGQAIAAAGIDASEIDLISGHLTGLPDHDLAEVKAWVKELGRQGEDFPLINAPKSMLGNCFAAAGSLEVIASILQLHHKFVHPSLNAVDLHSAIKPLIGSGKVPSNTIDEANLKYIAKGSFGFGGVHSCIILKKWQNS
ncbi:beta-ketoacyl synthase [Dyadobacter sp. CY312]|uniref:beta-ketoacyl-[acyl-carrier-protein] synthase family protein n=1 Tax=Dyadobacter sp. CY312 TaxID=2907303 RepID=UPI001F4351E6|nr:beta-ketoacyl synthase N-terminal-like domain-containing protein [Dyadobacter sp. CY312]MCE7044571.1 beta-ketoacyl-[acyl-carrier-protein] synthase family protein [Dyadobacter sp. CY312]